MSETTKMVFEDQRAQPIEKYFSFRIKGWANFDPMDKSLAKVAERTGRGDGFLTLVEVLRVEENVNSINDEEAKECFGNLLAARRLVQNVHELPESVREELCAVLEVDAIVPNNIVTLSSAPIGNDESAPQVKRWP